LLKGSIVTSEAQSGHAERTEGSRGGSSR